MPAPEFQEAFQRTDIPVLSSGMTMSYGVYGHSFDKMDPPPGVIIGGLLTACHGTGSNRGQHWSPAR